MTDQDGFYISNSDLFSGILNNGNTSIREVNDIELCEDEEDGELASNPSNKKQKKPKSNSENRATTGLNNIKYVGDIISHKYIISNVESQDDYGSNDTEQEQEIGNTNKDKEQEEEEENEIEERNDITRVDSPLTTRENSPCRSPKRIDESHQGLRTSIIDNNNFNAIIQNLDSRSRNSNNATQKKRKRQQRSDDPKIVHENYLFPHLSKKTKSDNTIADYNGFKEFTLSNQVNPSPQNRTITSSDISDEVSSQSNSGSEQSTLNSLSMLIDKTIASHTNQTQSNGMANSQYGHSMRLFPSNPNAAMLDSTCFGCIWAHKVSHIKNSRLTKLEQIFEEYFFQIPIDAVADKICAYYTSMIYEPSRRMGNCLPVWTKDMIKIHIECHLHEPRVFIGKSIITAEKTAMCLTEHFFYETSSSDKITPNYPAMKEWREQVKVMMMLYRLDYKKMFGYNSDIKIDPSNLSRLIKRK